MLVVLLIIATVICLLILAGRRSDPIWSYAPLRRRPFKEWRATEVDRLWP